MCRGVYDVLKSSYTLETFVYQLVTCKKCKMAVKVHTLIYKGVAMSKEFSDLKNFLMVQP